LTEAQRETFERDGTFLVRSGNGRAFRLSRSSPPALLREDGLTENTYCIHTSGVPREDELLGFKLMLEANPALFLRTANATRVNPPLPVAIAAD
jgi:hypothetical protein